MSTYFIIVLVFFFQKGRNFQEKKGRRVLILSRFYLQNRHLATCSADTTVKIWSTSRYEFALEKTLVGHQRWVWDAAFSADSAYLVTGEHRRSAPNSLFLGQAETSPNSLIL